VARKGGAKKAGRETSRQQEDVASEAKLSIISPARRKGAERGIPLNFKEIRVVQVDGRRELRGAQSTMQEKRRAGKILYSGATRKPGEKGRHVRGRGED